MHFVTLCMLQLLWLPLRRETNAAPSQPRAGTFPPSAAVIAPHHLAPAVALTPATGNRAVDDRRLGILCLPGNGLSFFFVLHHAPSSERYYL